MQDAALGASQSNPRLPKLAFGSAHSPALGLVEF
jgi:hypothetical protein